MKNRFFILILLLATNTHPIGQSAVITLVFPSGARSHAMGEVGTALADDEQVAFFNPAGLGMDNDRWHGGAVTEFYEQLLPAFKIPDLWHHNMAWMFQPANREIGGFAVFWNYINFGTNAWTDENGYIKGRARSYEEVFNISWGFNFHEIGLKNHYFGLSVKYALSALAPGYGPGGEGIGQTIAFDAGYLWQCLPGLRVGLNLQNMGPAIFYVSESEKDPIPFTINLGLAYTHDFNIGNLQIGQIRTEVRADREVVKNYFDKPPDPFWKAIWTDLIHDTTALPDTTRSRLDNELDEINWHLGVEYTILNSLSLREGFLFDRMGKRFEHHFGIGLRILNHFELDWGMIYAPEGYMRGLFENEGSNGSRHGQWRISFTYIRGFDWRDADRTWWMKR
jgi:hypothetical protein